MAVQVRNDELVDLLLPDFYSRLDEIIHARIVRALTAAGLRLEDDAGNLGVFVEDGGRVGVGTDTPLLALHVAGNARVGDGTNITPDDQGSGQLQIDGNAYDGFVALDGTGMNVGHNSSVRALILMTNETARLTIAGNGNVSLGNGLNFSLDQIRALDADGLQLADDGGTIVLLIADGGYARFSRPVVYDRSDLTISGGAITVTGSYHRIDTEAGASSDDLDTINGIGFVGQRLVLQALDSTHTVVVKDGTGNLRLNGDFSLDNQNDKIELIAGTSAVWHELSRSDNDA